MDIESVSSLAVTVLTGAVGLALIYAVRVLHGKIGQVLHQTVNNHPHSEYPNLRDELTAVRLASQEASEAVRDLADDVAEDRKSARKELEGIREDVRTLSQRLDVHVTDRFE